MYGKYESNPSPHENASRSDDTEKGNANSYASRQKPITAIASSVHDQVPVASHCG
jgi:hypothetical protein